MKQDEMNYTDREILMNSELNSDVIPERALKEILTELKQGNKISAIKIYREVTGEGLWEAKRAIESVKIKAHYPEKDLDVDMGVKNNFLMYFIMKLHCNSSASSV